MIKVDIGVQFSQKLTRTLDKLSKPINKATADDIGNAVIREMKGMIAQGESPVAGVGKFRAYKDKKKYPGKLKPHTPVNLRLTGDFLDALSFKVIQGPYGYLTRVFYKGSKQDKKEQGHAEGANGQPKRPTIPTDGKQFARRIQRVFMEIINERIFNLTKGGG